MASERISNSDLPKVTGLREVPYSSAVLSGKDTRFQPVPVVETPRLILKKAPVDRGYFSRTIRIRSTRFPISIRQKYMPDGSPSAVNAA